MQEQGYQRISNFSLELVRKLKQHENKMEHNITEILYLSEASYLVKIQLMTPRVKISQFAIESFNMHFNVFTVLLIPPHK